MYIRDTRVRQLIYAAAGQEEESIAHCEATTPINATQVYDELCPSPPRKAMPERAQPGVAPQASRNA
eukprot:4231506-Pyramimonas_sp.AAC.1